MSVVVSKSNTISDPDIRRKIHQALDVNLSYSRPSGNTVSVSETLAIIRNGLSGCDFPDNILTDIIAGHAIQRNYNMHFDMIKSTVPYTLILEKGL